MKKIFMGLMALIVAFVAPTIVSASASQKAAEPFVSGKVICRTCYLKDKSNGTGISAMAHEGVPEYDEGDPAHCAMTCSKKGMPMALLTRDGKLYTVTGKLAAVGDVMPTETNKPLRLNEPNAGLVTHIGHTITVFGEITEQNGQLEIASTRRTWEMDAKDWRPGSTTEIKHKTGGSQIIEQK